MYGTKCTGSVTSCVTADKSLKSKLSSICPKFSACRDFFHAARTGLTRMPMSECCFNSGAKRIFIKRLFENLPDAPKNESGLAQMIIHVIGKCICH